MNRSMMKVRIGFVAAVAASTSMLLLATTGPAQGAGSKSGTVKVGLINSYSGDLGVYGPQLQLGLNLAVKEVNAKGILVGGKRFKISLVNEDDQSDQNMAVSDAVKLMNDDGIKFVFGPFAQLSAAVVPLAAKDKVINFSASSAVAPLAGTSKYPLLFATLPSLQDRVQAEADAVKKFEPTAQKIAIVAPSGATSQTTLPALEAALSNAGYQVSEFIWPAGSTDLSVTMTQVAAWDPDALVLGWLSTDLQTEASVLSAVGIPTTMPIFAYGSPASLSTLFGGRPYIADPLVSSDFTVTSATTDALTFEKDLYGTSTPPATATVSEFYYGSLLLLADAMHAANSTTNTAKIAQYLKRVSINSLIGPISFNKTTNSMNSGFDMTLVSGGTESTLHVG